MVQPSSQKGAAQNSSQCGMKGHVSVPSAPAWSCLKSTISQSDISERWRCPGGTLSLAPTAWCSSLPAVGQETTIMAEFSKLLRKAETIKNLRIFYVIWLLQTLENTRYFPFICHLDLTQALGCTLLRRSLCARPLPFLKEKDWEGGSKWVCSGASGWHFFSLWSREGVQDKKKGRFAGQQWLEEGFWRSLWVSFLPPHSCPCYGFSSSDKWSDTLECTALQCNGDAALIMTLVFRYFQQKEGLGRRKEWDKNVWTTFSFSFCSLSLC